MRLILYSQNLTVLRILKLMTKAFCAENSQEKRPFLSFEVISDYL